jgi:hypothetical protein
MLIMKYDTLNGLDGQEDAQWVCLCYHELVVSRDWGLLDFGCFNVNRKSGEEFTRVIPFKYFTLCDKINKISTFKI